jgi:hypothetical protein
MCIEISTRVERGKHRQVQGVSQYKIQTYVRHYLILITYFLNPRSKLLTSFTEFPLFGRGCFPYFITILSFVPNIS